MGGSFHLCCDRSKGVNLLVVFGMPRHSRDMKKRSGSGHSTRQAGWQTLLRAGGVAVLCLCAMPFASVAQTVDAERARAISTWLAEDELAGLRDMARLAQEGDAASRLLLGLIDKNAALQGPDIVALSRDQRIALLRAPGGLSGRNWVQAAAAQGTPGAQAWQALWAVQADLTTAQTFAALGETRAAAETLLTLAKRSEGGFDSSVLEDTWFPSTLLFLSPDRTLSAEHAGQLHPGDPQHRFGQDGGKPAEVDLRMWLAESEAALHLRATCATACPETQSDCQFALYKALGSYEALLTHGTPVASLVEDAVFADSPRGRAALARRIMLMRSTRMREAERVRLAEVDACAADWLRQQFEAHTPRKIPGPAN